MGRRFRNRARRPSTNALVTLVALLVGCAGAKPLTTGFLGDYSQLKPGRGDQARLIYIDRDANFARYESVIVDRVVAWGGADELQPSPTTSMRRCAGSSSSTSPSHGNPGRAPCDCAPRSP